MAYEADPSLAPALADLATPSLSSLRPNQVVTCSTSQLKRIFLRKFREGLQMTTISLSVYFQQ